MPDKLLADAARSGLYFARKTQAKDILEAARKLHFATLRAELSTSRTMPEVLAKLGKDLAFPDWYGGNLDALFDCLSDPAWNPGQGLVLMISGIDHLRLANPEAFATLIDVLQAAIETRRDAGMPFWLLLDAPAAGLPDFPEA
jgi:RNAse (barnase) inhibitor barstar